MTTLHRDVDGVMAPISAGEAAQIIAEWEEAAASPTPLKSELYKTDIIARMTDEELDAFDAELAAASTRKRRMWTDCVTVRADSAYWPVLKAGFVAAFGQARANAILSLD